MLFHHPVLVSGLVNIENTLRIEGFPLEYSPVLYPFNGTHSSVSGVGVNVAKALTRLGSTVHFLSIIGNDYHGEWTRRELIDSGISGTYLVPLLSETAQSVILYDREGRRQIHVDLKDLQTLEYPEARFRKAMQGCDICCLCNINFSRAMLSPAREAGKLIATDVHVLSNPDDDYNRDFLSYADIVFLSNENLWDSPEKCAEDLYGRYHNRIIVIGLGSEGASMLEEGSTSVRVHAVNPRPVINTIGAGDALFSAFVYFYSRGIPAAECLKRAVYFAGWKIGEKGAAAGFLDEQELETLMKTPGT